MKRTIVVQLNPNPEQSAILTETLVEYTDCYNTVCIEGFATLCKNGVELHKRTYYSLREKYPELPAQLVCSARVKATESIKSALTWAKKYEKSYPKRVEKAQKYGKPIPTYKPVQSPHSACCSIRYDNRSYWVKFEKQTASLATVSGRMELNFIIPKHAIKYIDGKIASADLCYRHGKFTLHIVVELPSPQIASIPNVIGIDLGLNHPAVTSNHQFMGQRQWKEQERRIFRIRRKLQAKGTKSARRHLRKLSGKLLRQRKDHDHVISKRIVQNAKPGSTIVLENLTHIRDTSKIEGKQNKRRFHSWSFTQLFDFIEYKAEARGIQVVKVDPRHTSQTCSKCGYQARNNRRTQSLFLCRHCGYSLNADLNASINIREKYVSSRA